ncbi:MAG: hypothetical protein IKE46_04550 [Selenomonadaceae bacterium]|nr:hypothetical protein [Selenomonadaceae bacterium]
MKKFLTVLATVLLLTSSVAFAAFEEKLEDGVDLSTIKKIAIAMPEFYKVEEREPTLEELIEDLGVAGIEASTLEILPYNDVIAAIKRDTGIDVHSLEPAEAEKFFLKNVKHYADVYLVLTVANNSAKPWLFYYIYDANTTKLLYTYSVQSRLLGHSAKDYFNSSKDFFKHFDDIAPQKLEGQARKDFIERQKQIRKEKSKVHRLDEKTGRNKVELVRKK